MNKVKVTIRKAFQNLKFYFYVEIEGLQSMDSIESTNYYFSHEACVKAATEFCNNTFKSWEFV